MSLSHSSIVRAEEKSREQPDAFSVLSTVEPGRSGHTPAYTRVSTLIIV